MGTWGHGDMWRVGEQECWSAGVLECWSAGVFRMLESWSVRALDSIEDGLCRSQGILNPLYLRASCSPRRRT